MGNISVGYKSTDVGVIPEDWFVSSIDELFDFLRTASNSRADLGDSGIVAYVHYGDIHTRFRHFIDFSRNDVPRLLAGKTVTATRLCDGDLIVADASEDEVGVGKSVEVRNLGSTEAVSGLHTFLLRPKNRRSPLGGVQRGYCGYILEKPPVKRQLRRLSTGLKVFGISKQALKGISIPLPKSTEQHSIAEALSDADNLLDSLDALIDKKRAIMQAAIKQLLTGKTRLAGFNGKWQTKRLGDLAQFFKGSFLSKSDLSLDGRRRCIHYGELFTTYGERIDDILHGTNREGNFSVSLCNDVLMPTSDVTPNGLATASCILIPQIVIGGDILVIRTSVDILNGVFLAYTIKAQRNQVMQLVSGTTVFHIRARDMATFKFLLPSIEEQNAIVTVLHEMDSEITALDQRLQKARGIKEGMMQQLLTGRIRLV